MLAWGWLLAVLGGYGLAPMRLPNAPVHHLAVVALRFATLLCFPLLILQLFDVSPDWRTRWDRKLWWSLLVLALCSGLSCWQRGSIWAAPVASLGVAQFIWVRSKSEQSSYPLAVAGWVWAGLYPLTLPWPNEQRFYLALVLGGAATALQGAWEVVRYLRGHKPQWMQEPVG